MSATHAFPKSSSAHQAGSVYLTGVIDLAFKEPDGNVLGDYDKECGLLFTQQLAYVIVANSPAVFD